MSDDPRAILAEAEVECAEVDAYFAADEYHVFDFGEAAILALARLVAKYKWQRDECLRLAASTGWNRDSLSDEDFVAAEIAALERDWSEREA